MPFQRNQAHFKTCEIMEVTEPYCRHSLGMKIMEMVFRYPCKLPDQFLLGYYQIFMALQVAGITYSCNSSIRYALMWMQ